MGAASHTSQITPRARLFVKSQLVSLLRLCSAHIVWRAWQQLRMTTHVASMGQGSTQVWHGTTAS